MLDFTSLALLSAFFAGVANVLARLYIHNIKPQTMMSVSFMFMGLAMLPFAYWFFDIQFALKTLVLISLIVVIDMFANLLSFRVFKKAEAGIATPLLSLAPISSFLFGWLLIDDEVSLIQLVLASFILILVISLSYGRNSKGSISKSVLVAGISASILFGLSAIPAKELLAENLINSPTLYMIRAFLISILALFTFGIPKGELTGIQYRNLFFRGLFVIAQWVLLYSAIQKGSAGVALTLSNTTPVFVLIIGYFVLKEKISAAKIMTAILVLVLALII